MVKKTIKKQRPPRIFETKSGRRFILIKGKKYYLKVDDNISTKSLIKLFLKYLLPRKQSRSKRKKRTTRKEDRVIISDFNKLEHENRNQVNDQLDKLKQEKYEKIQKIEKDTKEAKEEADKQEKKIEKNLDEVKSEAREALRRIEARKIAVRSMPRIAGATTPRRETKRPASEQIDPAMFEILTDQLKNQVKASDTTANIAMAESEEAKEQAKTAVEQKERAQSKLVKTITDEEARKEFMERLAKSKGALLISDLEHLIPASERTGRQTKSSLINILVRRTPTANLRVANKVAKSKLKEYIKDGKLTRGLSGKGLAGVGLTTDDLNEMLKKHKWFLGTIASDMISTLKPEDRKQFGFIMNKDISSKGGSHWVAVWINTATDKSIEYYDPLAKKPSKHFQEDIKGLVDKLKLPFYLKFKINKIKNQSNTSDTCGFHSARFLMERAKGNEWRFSTGFTDLKEREANQFRIQRGYGYI